MKPQKKMTLLFMVKAVLILVIILSASSSTAADKSSLPSGSAQPAKKLLKIGHRGAAGLAPENTLAAFRKACELGVDAIELDVYLAGDSSAVVHHDYTLNPQIARTADGEWLSLPGPAIKDLTLAQLKTYDVDIDDFQGSIPRAVKAAGGRHWAPYYKHLTNDLLKEAHELGLKVYVWTVDSRSEMLRLMEMGVDGIITNRPDILKSVVGSP